MVEHQSPANAAGAPAPERQARRVRSVWRRPQPMAAYLLMLALVTLVPAFLYAGLVLERNSEAQHDVVETLVYGTAGSAAQSIDRELSSMLTTLRVLATLPSLHEGDYETFYSRAHGALEGSGNYMLLLDEDLQQLLNTRVGYGAALSPTSDPASALRALESGEPTVSDVFFGRTSGHWVFNVALPVETRSGAPRVLILTRNAENLSETLRGQQLPPGWQVALLDTRGTVIASSDPETTTGEDFFLLTGQAPSIGTLEETAGGVDYSLVVQPSLNADWQVVAWAPEEVLREPFRHSFELLVVGGLLIGGAAVLAVAWLSRRIGRSIGRLAADAERLGAGDDLEPFDSPISEVATVSAALSGAAHARRAAENEIRFLMREVAHRSKNQLAVIAAIAKQTAKGADDVEAFESAFQTRLQGLARSTDLMVREDADGVELRALVETQIEPFRPPQPERVAIAGPRRRLSIQGAQMLGMAVHELATNAAKYGAFAGSEGRLEVDWRLDEAPGGAEPSRLVLVWRERGVAGVAESGRSGFGTMVVERMVGHALDAGVRRRLHEDGIEWRFEIPLASLEGADAEAGRGSG